MPFSFIGRFFDKFKSFFSYDYKDYSFRIDLQYGELYFTRKLISFSGKHLPLNLSLNYSQMHVNAYDNLNTYTGFPRGFKTNYHVFLEYNSSYNKYIYEDKDGFKHEFVLAINSSTLYCDSFGSGLMLITTNNGYKVFDDDGNYQLFDQYGRLITIHKKITNSHYAEQNIAYTDNLLCKISTITDNYNRTISFSYSTSSIQISYNNNVVVTLYLNNYLLTKISKNIGGHLVEDTINQASWVLTNIVLSSGEIFDFSYTDDQVDRFITNIKQDVFEFDYDMTGDKWATVTNARGVSTYYDFSENQSMSQTSENGNNLAYFKLNSDIASCLIKESGDNDEITDITFGLDEEVTFDIASYSFGYSNIISNNYLMANKMYLFVAEIEGNIGTEHFDLSLFDYDNNLLAKLIFKGSTRILAAPVGIKSTLPKSFQVAYGNFAFNTITVVKTRIIPLIGDFEILCSNVYINGPIFFYNDEPHYLLPNGSIDKYNNTYIANEHIIIKPNDLLADERLFYKANSTFHFWSDDKKKLFDGLTSAYIFLNASYYLGYDSSYGKLALYDSSYNLISDIYFYTIKGKDDNSLTITKSSHDSSAFHTGYTSFYFEEEVSKYIAGSLSSITYYDYDENYNLNEVNRSDGYKEVYSYDNNGSLIDKVISHTNSNKKFENGYEYDSNDNPIYEYKFIGSSFERIEYYYDSFNNLESIAYPNQSSKCFNYDSVTGERNIKTRFVSAHYNINQNNNYIDGNNSSLSISNSAYAFNYINGKLNSVSYNNEQILNISYQTGIYGNTPLNIGETINYSNGGSVYTEYDAFDRLYVKDNTEYSYDNDSNLYRIIDGSVGQYNAYTFYSYDYFNRVVGIEVHYNNLSLNFTYDIYHRLTNENYLLYGNDLYEINYFYYNKPDLQNIIKSSSLTYNNSSISVTNDVDGFSRLSKQTITIGNSSVTKTFAYCSNSSLTSNMISSIYWNDYMYINGTNTFVMVGDIYTYDTVGNIVSITRKIFDTTIYQTTYEYDELNRLTRENNPSLNKSYRYTYDCYGNTNFKKEYAYTTGNLPSNPAINHTYSYSATYPNRLISFDGQSITYDTVGNPLTYLGKSMSWIKGTLLSSVNEGNNYINLYYDGFNQRIRKETNSETTYYKYINNKLISEENNSYTITFLYSHISVIGFIYSNAIYYYEKNIMQDVINIRNSNNAIVASYIYDAFGNHKVLNSNGTINTSPSFIGNINPIRYRSYYYDKDLKMYWLTTRYYDPEVGRFISPDHYSYLDYQKLHGLNLYAYSKNNPVMYYDPNGHFLLNLLIATLLIWKGVATIVNSFEDKEIDKKEEKGKIERGESKAEIGSHKLSSGRTVYYLVPDKKLNEINWNNPETSLRILDSWDFSKSEMREFLEWLKDDANGGKNAINVDRMLNEWIWHNKAFSWGIAKGHTRSVDVCLDADDTGDYSWILNWRLWA